MSKNENLNSLPPDKHEQNKQIEQKVCFVISPIGEANTSVRRAVDGLIDAVLEPLLDDLNYKTVVAHRMSNSGSITTQIIEQLLQADMVIANLSQLNANVMYELASRHAKRLPVVCLAEAGTNLPFDIAPERTIFYNNDMGGVVELKKQLADAIVAAANEKLPQNPIYRAVMHSIMESALDDLNKQSDEKSVLKYLMFKLDSIEQHINKMAPKTPNVKSSLLFLPLVVSYDFGEKHENFQSFISDVEASNIPHSWHFIPDSSCKIEIAISKKHLRLINELAENYGYLEAILKDNLKENELEFGIIS